MATAQDFRLKVDRVAINAPSGGGASFQQVTFRQGYNQAPAVFVLPSNANPDPATVRIRNVTTTGFEIAVVESTGEDGANTGMTVDYFAAEPGTYNFPGGVRMLVARIATTNQQGSGVSSAWQAVSFGNLFSAAPAVIAQIQTSNSQSPWDPSNPAVPWLETAIRNVASGGMDVALERGETSTGTVVTETIAYLAIDSGSSGSLNSMTPKVDYAAVRSADNVTGWDNGCVTVAYGKTFAGAPLVVASQNSRDGGDGGFVRRCALAAASVGLTIDEDRARDTERSHTSERAGVLAFSSAFHGQVSGGRMEASQVTVPPVTPSPTPFTRVTFPQAFPVAPLVFALPTADGALPSAIRLRNISVNGFDIAAVLAPPGGSNAPMTVDYVAITPGVHNVGSGTVLEAGSISTRRVQHGSGAGPTGWDTISFAGAHPARPAVLLQIQTINNEPGLDPSLPSIPWLVTAARNIGVSSMDIALDRAEVAAGGNNSAIAAETVAFLAVASGTIDTLTAEDGSLVDFEAFFSSSIVGWDNSCNATAFSRSYSDTHAVASQATRNGGNGGWVRRCGLTASSIGILVDEDQAKDTERAHTGETASVVVFDRAFVARSPATPVGAWYMEADAWSGVAGEVKDASGNGLHGTAVNGTTTRVSAPALPGSPGSCRYGEYDGLDDYLVIPDDGLLDGSQQLTLAAWIRPDQFTQDNGTNARGILSKRDSFNSTEAYGLFFLNGAGGRIYVDINNSNDRFASSASLVASNWSHVTVVFDGSQAAAQRVRLYINGVLDSVHAESSSTVQDSPSNLYIGNLYTGAELKVFKGAIDEVQVFRDRLLPWEIALLMQQTRPCAALPSLNGFQVDTGSGVASTCLPRDVTIRACADQACSMLDTEFEGTVELRTSTGHGNWGLQTAAGVLTPDPHSADDGRADYEFVLADAGEAKLTLSNVHADDLVISVTDPVSSFSASSATTVFRDNVLVLDDVDPLPGQDLVVAGRGHQFNATMWRRDASQTPAQCAVASAYSGARTLQAWISRAAADPGGLPPALGATPLPGSRPAGGNVTLNFVAGQASFVLNTTDVGKFALNLADANRDFATGVDILGSTATTTVRPFAFRFTAIRGSAAPQVVNPGGDETSGGGFVAAGDDFEGNVDAILHQSADDADDDGQADTGANLFDNSLTPAFRGDTLIGLDSYTPAGGVAGLLSPLTPLAPAVSFSGGSAAMPAISYSEVGAIRLTAGHQNYLGTAAADIAGESPQIGRFFPAGFERIGATVTPACSVGTVPFTYMDAPQLGLALQLLARNRAGVTTRNYDDALGYQTGNLLFHAENGDDGVDLGFRLTVPAGVWQDGAYVLPAGTGAYADNSIAFARAAVPDGPYAQLQVGAALVAEPDNRQILPMDMNAATSGDCSADSSCTATILGVPAAFRYGRALTFNAYGPETQELPLPVLVEYFNGLRWVVNMDDGDGVNACTLLPLAALDLQSGSAPGVPIAVGAGSSIGLPAYRSASDFLFAAGDANMVFSAPGDGNSGEISIRLDLSAQPWLRYDWNVDGAFVDDPPPTTASFGHFRGHDRIIYWRER